MQNYLENRKLRENIKEDGSIGRFQPDCRVEKRFMCLYLVFSNVIMSLAMKVREKAKSLRESQQLDLQMARELKQFNASHL